MASYLDILNPEQKEAVTSTEGYVRVIAGAGSGKTKTLAGRYAYLVDEIGISPSNILCVTFTNKAAAEMKERINSLLEHPVTNDLICTYHGFAVRVLREDIHKIEYPSSFTIMDEEDQKALLHEIYEELGIKQKEYKYSDMLRYISHAKCGQPPYEGFFPFYLDNYIASADDSKSSAFFEEWDSKELVWRCIMRYVQKQRKGFLLDFDDLINYCLYIFENFEDVRQKWQSRLDYIMVDETQDNNQTQWRLVDILQQKHRNLFVVGDPDQCIYEWRGANPDQLVSLDRKYKNCQTIILNRNYRSTPDILNVANAVIARNINRVPKDLSPNSSKGTKVVHYHADNEEKEGEYIVNKIAQNFKAEDVAILYRASHQSRFIEQALIRKKIPYTVYGGVRFYERKEIKDSISYLKLAVSDDDMAFLRVINVPSRKLGKKFVENLKHIANMEGKALYPTLLNHLEDSDIGKAGAKAFVEVIEEARKMSRQENVSSIISNTLQFLLDKSGLGQDVRDDGDDSRVANLNDLMQSIRTYEEVDRINGDTCSIVNYLQDISLYTNLDRKATPNSVRLMTIHQSKGLEFPVVFVIGMSDGIFPSERSIRDRKMRGLEEERRLAYVAFTRAKELLFLTESEGYSFETEGDKYPSRFIFEIPKNLLMEEGELAEYLREMAERHFRLQNKTLREEEGIEDEDESPTLVNKLIVHKIFGKGIILSVEEETDTIIIQFDKFPEPRHLALEKTLKLISDVVVS